MSQHIIIMGGGGHAKVVIDAISAAGVYNIQGIVDPGLPKGSKVAGCTVLGGDEVLEGIYKSGTRQAFVAVASIGNCDIRKRLAATLKERGFTLPVICHPSSIIAKDVRLGAGTFVAAGAVINPGTVLGENTIVNTRASVDHDCTIGDFTHIAPGAVLCGGITIGNEVHIGAGVTVIQNIKIGNKAFIKVGRPVTQNVEEGNA